MAEVSAAQVKSLREATGLGMMECKKALVESEGDIDKARQLLRIRGQSKAEKVAGRSTGEGRVGVLVEGNAGAIVQVNCETDFVAKDENFVGFVDFACGKVLADGNGTDSSPPIVEEERQALVLKLGENVAIEKAGRMEASGDESRLASYVHQGAKIGVLADVNSGSGGEQLERSLCMHIAAMRPEWVRAEDVPQEVIEKEKEVYRAQLADSGKPPEVAEKVVMGKLKKFLAEVCLESQPFVRDDQKTVGQVLKEANATVAKFVRMEVGR